MPKYYAVKPSEWENGREYTTFAVNHFEAVANFLDNNAYDADYDGFIIVIEIPI